MLKHKDLGDGTDVEQLQADDGGDRVDQDSLNKSKTKFPSFCTAEISSKVSHRIRTLCPQNLPLARPGLSAALPRKEYQNSFIHNDCAISSVLQSADPHLCASYHRIVRMPSWFSDQFLIRNLWHVPLHREPADGVILPLRNKHFCNPRCGDRSRCLHFSDPGGEVQGRRVGFPVALVNAIAGEMEMLGFIDGKGRLRLEKGDVLSADRLESDRREWQKEKISVNRDEKIDSEMKDCGSRYVISIDVLIIYLQCQD